MSPSLEDMQVFSTVVDAGSFTQAAEILGRTKSAVSQSVTRLESDLGAQLLYRSTRSLSLTEVGRHFYRHCCDIRDSYTRALGSIKDTEPSGHLTIAAPQALTPICVVPAISDLLQAYNRLDVTLLADDSPADLIEGQIDVAIRVGRVEHQTAKVRRLGYLSEGLYASSEYIEAFNAQSKECLTHADGLAQAQHIAQQWQGRRISYRDHTGLLCHISPKLRCNSVHDALALARHHQGVVRLPDGFVQQSGGQDGLHRLLPLANTPIYSVHFFAKRAPKKVQAFIECLKTYLH